MHDLEYLDFFRIFLFMNYRKLGVTGLEVSEVAFGAEFLVDRPYEDAEEFTASLEVSPKKNDKENSSPDTIWVEYEDGYYVLTSKKNNHSISFGHVGRLIQAN